MTRSLGVGLQGHRAASAPAAHTSACLPSVAEVLSECRLLAYISQVPTQMSFLFRLINIIHVQTLTQVRGLQTCPQERGLESYRHPGATFTLEVPLLSPTPSFLGDPPAILRTCSNKGSAPHFTEGAWGRSQPLRSQVVWAESGWAVSSDSPSSALQALPAAQTWGWI